MTDQECLDILNQIINRSLIAAYLLEFGPPELRPRIVTLLEDSHEDSQRITLEYCTSQ
jgi:hypothetical protein